MSTSAAEQSPPSLRGSREPRESPTAGKEVRAGGHTSDEAVSLLSEGKSPSAEAGGRRGPWLPWKCFINGHVAGA